MNCIVTKLNIFFDKEHVKERKRTGNYVLTNTPSQGLIVLGTLDINFHTYFQFEFLVMYKHVHAMYLSLLLALSKL